ELQELGVAADKQLIGEKRGMPSGELALVATRQVPDGPGKDVFRLSLENQRRIGEFRAALPFLGDARVAGFRERARPEVGADVKRILVLPGNPALGLRNREAILDEVLGDDIKLALYACIGPTAGEGDDAALILGLQEIGPVEDPVFFFLLAERIQVEHGLPVRLLLAVLVERGPPPQAALVLVVAPEVVVPRTMLDDGG